MRDTNLSEITYVRLSAEQRAELERIAASHGLTKRVSDHIRLAVDQYIATNQAETTAAQQPTLRS